ncbi:MAG: response regulator, partial [Verrucomicrobia bacterium]|nr:response regulator [Verrucomicrobiota bacterium]
ELAGQNKSPIDLLITDMVMPGMNGRELMERMRALSPRTRVVCASGRVMGQAAGDDLSFLPKPFTAQELLRKVKEALATRGGTGPRSPLPPGNKK